MLAAVAAAVLPVSAAGQDLLQIYREALANDAVYAAARYSVDAGRERGPQGRALLLPAISANANTNYNDREIAFRNGTSAPGRFNSNGYTVALTQPTF